MGSMSVSCEFPVLLGYCWSFYQTCDLIVCWFESPAGRLTGRRNWNQVSACRSREALLAAAGEQEDIRPFFA